MFCGTDGEGVVGYAVVRVDEVTVVCKTGFLLGYKLILGGELVTKGLNDVVFGFEFAGMNFEKDGFLRF